MASNPKPIRRLAKRYGLMSFKEVHVFRGSCKALNLGRIIPHSILYKRKVIPCKPWHWAIWFEYSRARIIKQTALPDGVRVSTVYLGLADEQFETMIFGGLHNNYQTRCTNYDEALTHHETAIHRAFELV